MYCRYFTAKILKEKTWLFTGLLKNEDGIAFERALDPKNELFEFFVPESQVSRFLEFVKCAEKIGLVTGPLCEQENRLEKSL